jgi:NAD(P)-dependent dehydrogenase (short-subunit alcohol dehydrogenase family)
MFTGQVIIVTGAAGNVGSALATVLASRGARIAAVDTAKDKLEAVTAGLSGGGHLALADYDLTDPIATNSLIATVRQTCGRLNGVGTTVGGFAMAKLAMCTARGLWDTGLKPTPPRPPVEAASAGRLTAS